MLPGELPKPKRWRLRGRRAGRGCILPHTACDRKPTHTARPRQCALWLPLHLPAAPILLCGRKVPPCWCHTTVASRRLGQWHDCHQHWHYDNYAHYALRDLCTNDTVAWEDRAVVGHKNGWCVTRPICIHMHLHLHLSVYYTYAHPIHAPATVPATVQADVAACKHAIARARANTTILTPYLLLWPHPHPSIA